MKKLKLDFQHLGNAEVLTRSQLKKIMGGEGGSGGEGDKKCTGTCSGGDHLRWSLDCTKPNEWSFCSCPRTDATTSNCLMAQFQNHYMS